MAGEQFSGIPEDMDWQALYMHVVTCARCPRLVSWRQQVARERRKMYRDWDYWGRPVPGLGDPDARLLVVGLAPAAHGGNRTGRVFTGDSSGDFLFSALHKAGFANQPRAEFRGDGLRLTDVYIAAAARCAPPDNKPTPQELDTCQPYLETELRLLAKVQGVVALGQIAFDRLLKIYGQRGPKFGHGAFYRLPDGLPWLLASYHPSRQNTQTGRLTEDMFAEIWFQARDLLNGA